MSGCEKANGAAKSDCEIFAEHLWQYVDHELEGSLQDRMGQHLQDCRHCLRMFQDEEKLRDCLQISCTQAAPPGLRERICSQISQENYYVSSQSVIISQDGSVTSVQTSCATMFRTNLKE